MPVQDLVALRLIALACSFALAPAVQAQNALSADLDPAAGAVPLRQMDARLRMGAERVHLPQGERMGLVGLTELFNVVGPWWAGPGVYGAATGQRGGLFVPGVEVAWSHPFSDLLAVDAGLFAGGGGGAAAPVGGGLMLRPHVDLVFRLRGFYTGPTWSKVRFTTGRIDANQVGWMINVDSSFRFRPADAVGPTDGSATGLGFDRIAATVTMARPRNSRTTAGAPLAQTIGLVGVRAERDVDGPLWAGIEAAGAGSGGVAGYAEVLGTAGLRWPVVGDRLSLGVRGSLGLGGGGGIDTGGGLLAKVAAGGTLRVTDALALDVEGGVADAPQGRFKALTGAVALNWTLAPPPTRLADWNNTRPASPTRMEFAAATERYRAARKDGSPRVLDAVALQVNRFVTPQVYLTGQVHSAYAGGAGAYSVGLFGLGAQLPVVARVRAGAEALAGAAGGGGVDTRGGAVAQARGYVDVALTDALSLRVGGGRIRSVHGGLDAPVVDAALVFRFGTDRARH